MIDLVNLKRCGTNYTLSSSAWILFLEKYNNRVPTVLSQFLLAFLIAPVRFWIWELERTRKTISFFKRVCNNSFFFTHFTRNSIWVYSSSSCWVTFLVFAWGIFFSTTFNLISFGSIDGKSLRFTSLSLNTNFVFKSFWPVSWFIVRLV